MVNITFGERIKYLRKKQGLSQEQLADKLNVSRQAVQKRESDINEPNIDTVKCIACFFNVDLNYLLNGKADEVSSKEFNSKNNKKFLNEKEKTNFVIYYIFLVLSFFNFDDVFYLVFNRC